MTTTEPRADTTFLGGVKLFQDAQAGDRSAVYFSADPQTIAMGDAAVTLLMTAGAANQITSNILYVDPESSGAAENLLLPPEADCEGLWLLIANTGGEDINVRNDASGAVISVLAGEAGMAWCNGTTWRGFQGFDAITATSAELSILDGVTATAAEINMAADSSANTEVVTTTNVITAAESGSTFVLNAATGFVSTLPAVAAGLRFTFYVGATAPSSGNHTVVPNAANDNTIFGEYLVAGATVPASAEGSINIVASTALPGDRVEVFCDGTNWYASGAAAATGAVTFTT